VINLIKKIQKLVLVLLSAVLIGTIFVPPIRVEANRRPLRDLHIVIDPGHGGRDPGAIYPRGSANPRYRESEVVLDISLRIRELFRNTDINIHMTRTTDVYRSLAQRSSFANNLNADLFVSVHLNSFTNPAANGTETYYIGTHGQAAALSAGLEDGYHLETGESNAHSINIGGIEVFEGDEDFEPRREMNPYLDIVPLSNDSNRRQNSRLLAQNIQRRKIQNLGLTDIGVRTANFHVLRETNMAAALSEIGFLSNAGDRAVMLTERGRRLSSEAIYLGILDYLVARGYDVPAHYFDLNPMPPQPPTPPQPSPPGDSTQISGMLQTGVTRLNTSFHQGPGTSYNVISTVTGSTNVRITGRTGDWYRVIVDGTTGFMRQSAVSRTRQNAVVSTNNAHVRAGRGTGYRSLTQVARGTRVRVDRRAANWSRITVNGHTGWIRNNDLYVENAMRPGRTIANNVAVHTRPRAGATVRHRLPSNTQLMIVQRTTDGWSQIRIPHNNGTLQGWVRTNQIENRVHSRRLVRNGALRSGRGTEFNRIATLPNNSNVTVRSRVGTWYHVHVNINGRRQYGWLHQNNLQRLPLR